MYYSMPSLVSKLNYNIVLLYGYSFTSLGNFAFHIRMANKNGNTKNNLVMEEHKMGQYLSSQQN